MNEFTYTAHFLPDNGLKHTIARINNMTENLSCLESFTHKKHFYPSILEAYSHVGETQYKGPIYPDEEWVTPS